MKPRYHYSPIQLAKLIKEDVDDNNGLAHEEELAELTPLDPEEPEDSLARERRDEYPDVGERIEPEDLLDNQEVCEATNLFCFKLEKIYVEYDQSVWPNGPKIGGKPIFLANGWQSAGNFAFRFSYGPAVDHGQFTLVQRKDEWDRPETFIAPDPTKQEPMIITPRYRSEVIYEYELWPWVIAGMRVSPASKIEVDDMHIDELWKMLNLSCEKPTNGFGEIMANNVISMALEAINEYTIEYESFWGIRVAPFPDDEMYGYNLASSKNRKKMDIRVRRPLTADELEYLDTEQEKQEPDDRRSREKIESMIKHLLSNRDYRVNTTFLRMTTRYAKHFSGVDADKLFQEAMVGIGKLLISGNMRERYALYASLPMLLLRNRHGIMGKSRPVTFRWKMPRIVELEQEDIVGIYKAHS